MTDYEARFKGCLQSGMTPEMAREFLEDADELVAIERESDAIYSRLMAIANSLSSKQGDPWAKP
jgi:hypothetical protein